MYHLKLYVTGETPSSRELIEQLRKIFDEAYDGEYRLDVINVFDSPEEVETDQIFVTPTLVRALPEPVRRLVGNLSDRERILAGIHLVNE